MNLPKTVGMIDDQSEWHDIAKAIFEGHGMKYTAIYPVESLIDEKDFGNFDLLLVDVQLGLSYNGFELAVKATKTDPETVIMTMSSEYTSSFALNCVQTKPLSYDKIMKAYNILENDKEGNKDCIKFRAIEYGKGLR